MRLTLAGVADAATVSSDGKLNVLGVFDVINVRQFPTVKPHFAYFARLEVEAEDPRSFDAELRIVDDDGQLVSPVVTLHIKVGKNEPGEVITIPIVLGISNARLQRPGIYTVELTVAG